MYGGFRESYMASEGHSCVKNACTITLDVPSRHGVRARNQDLVMAHTFLLEEYPSKGAEGFFTDRENLITVKLSGQ